MAAKKNTKNTKKSEVIEEKMPQEVENIQEEPAKTVVEPEKIQEKIEKAPKKEAKKSKFNVGDIVYIKKDAEADLNGFKLFPQYKKYTYTVEAYDEKLGVYSLRRLNLSLRLPESLILAPDERAHDSLNRKQF